MEAKEKIANKYGIIDGFTLHSNPSLAREGMHNAMQEYANEQNKALQDQLKEVMEERNEAKEQIKYLIRRFDLPTYIKP